MELSLFIIVFAIVMYLKMNKQIGKNKNSNKNKNFTNNTIDETLTVSELSKHFNISSRQLNQMFEKLEWIKKENRWWIVTNKGEENGGIQKYNPKNKTKYVKWKPSIKNNHELLELINPNRKKEHINLVHVNKKKKPLSYKEKIKKGEEYEKFIAEHFKSQGYTIAEHGKDNGVKDNGIDIIAKMQKNIYFIQCKNWSKESSYKIRDKELKVSRQDAKDYMMKHPLYVNGGYKMKLLYITSEDIFHKSALYYAEEHSDIIECKVMPMHT